MGFSLSGLNISRRADPAIIRARKRTATGLSLCFRSNPVKLMRLETLQQQGLPEIGALTVADAIIIGLQVAQQFRGGETNPHFQSVLAFVRGAIAARDAAQQAVGFVLSPRPEGATIERASVEVLAPVPRPESIRD